MHSAHDAPASPQPRDEGQARFNLVLPSDDLAWLERVAARDERSISAQLRYLIKRARAADDEQVAAVAVDQSAAA